MVVEFSVSNFRSIKHKQTISFEASSDRHLEDHLLRHGVNEREILPMLIGLGANASGKSNICRAILFLQQFTQHISPHLKNDAILEAEPFRLGDSDQKASCFEIVFIIDSFVWEYTLELNKEEITYEQVRRKKAVPGAYWSSVLKRQGAEIELWKSGIPGLNKGLFRRSRPDVSILSQSVSEGVPALRPLFEAIAGIKYRRMTGPPLDVVRQAVELFEDRPDMFMWLAKLIAIADEIVESLNVAKQDIEFGSAPDELKRAIEDRESDLRNAKLEYIDLNFCALDASGGKTYFNSSEMSDGTMRFLALMLGIWIALQDGSLFIVDEFDGSLHPLLAALVRDTMNDPDINLNGAQFLLTTHQAGLLDPERLRRDQILMVQRDGAKSTTVYALSALTPAPRSDEAFNKRYLYGNYGGVPKSRSLKRLFAEQIRTLNEPTA